MECVALLSALQRWGWWHQMKLKHRDLISLLIPVIVFECEDEHEEVKEPWHLNSNFEKGKYLCSPPADRKCQMSWLSKIRTAQGALRFLDSAGVTLELLSSDWKKYPAASIKLTDSAPYTRVTERIPSVGFQFFFDPFISALIGFHRLLQAFV